MEETVLFPSPNWFQTSGFVVSCDGWIIYGGPTKSLCVLEPIPQDQGVLSGKPKFKAHVANRAHIDRITCVAISPEWPEKKDILAGSADGMVKQWTLEQIGQNYRLKPTQSHEKHYQDKEEVAGVAYSQDYYAITVGCFGNIWKWDIKSNVVKIFKHLKAFKPTCISCSPHIPLNVAIGTKQGVVIVLDLSGAGKVLYKVRGQDDEILTVSWCPQYEVLVKKALGEPEEEKKKGRISVATQRMMKIRQLTDEEKREIAEMTKEKAEESDHEEKEVEVQIQDVKVDTEILEEKEQEKANVLEDSGIVKSLPEDSFDDTVVQEDDMFDIYKDFEADEFGHKKYQPEDILVKIKEDDEPADYLAECLSLKEEILKRKNQQEESMESLVKAMDDAHIEKTKELPSTSQSQASEEIPPKEVDDTEYKEFVQLAEGQTERVDHSVHVQKHMLASVGKYGSVRVWSKSGKLVGSCMVYSMGSNKNSRVKNNTAWTSVLWYKADVLLIGDCKSHLLECNPLKIDSKNKLLYQSLGQLHRRGLFVLATGAPRVQTPDQTCDHLLWTAGQDRNVVCYDVAKRQTVGVYATCGGFVYDVKACPYDAGKVAASVSDGAVRVWGAELCEEARLSAGRVHMHWQHVQGKVLAAAWHPSREHLLAFGTAESRVGLIDTHAKSEKNATNLLSVLNGGVYSLCWGDGYDLYASGGGALVVYKANKVDEAPKPIDVEWEGHKWELSAVVWRPNALLVGSQTGAVAVLSTEYPHPAQAVAFPFTKIIHTIDWHPSQTSNSSDESPLKNLIAVCSLDKSNNVAILEYVENEDGSKQLNSWKTLSGHKAAVLQVSWSPHHDELVLSTSQDNTVRIWDVVAGTNTHVFGGHNANTLCGIWSPFPQLQHAVLSGGCDGCLRLWDMRRYTADAYQEPTKDSFKKKKEKRLVKVEENPEQDEATVATTHSSIVRGDRKFLMPVLTKQLGLCSIQGVRKLLKMYIEKSSGLKQSAEEEDMEQSYKVNFVKIFGSIKEVNEVLDEELERHEDTGSVEPWLMLSLFRGHIDAMIQFASARDLLCPFLLSMAPCVSLKYWKDVTQLYLAQIDRLIAKGEEAKLFEPKQYGGAVFVKAATLLSAHDARGAVRALLDAKLYKDAYILCRTRYMDSIAEETLQIWSTDCYKSGNYKLATVCQIALGNITEAANFLSKIKDESWLALAAELAKVAGQTTFADHVLEKREQIKNNAQSDSPQEDLEQLPTRLELLLRENAARADMDDTAPKDNTGEKGQGDNMTEEAKEDINQNEIGQGDIKEETPKGDLSKETNKDVKEM